MRANHSKVRPAPAEEASRAYDRLAPLYDKLDAVYEWSWKRRLRAELFRHARGPRLLDVGVGTGCNMPFYPKGCTAAGIDASHGMLARADKRAQVLGLDVQLRQMDLLRLAYPDAWFDTTVATFVLLCLPDELQLPALRELARVTAPGGRVLILDYHGSSRRPVQIWTKAMAPWLRWAFAARFDPATERYVELAGLEAEHRQSLMGDGVIMLVLRHAQPS